MGILRRLFGRKYVPLPEVPSEQNASADGGKPASQGFYTSTATVVVYDLESLKHRLDDDADWWADPKSEMDEINLRNVLIIGLGFDGYYDVDVIEEDSGTQAYSLRFPSGKIFIGPGELMTGGGDEPDESCSGIFLNLAAGDYRVSIQRVDDQLKIGLIPAPAFDNAVIEPVAI